MPDDSDFEERYVRWTIGGSVAALASVGCLVLLWAVFGVGTAAEETGERELAAVTFVVGGMLKSRSGIT